MVRQLLLFLLIALLAALGFGCSSSGSDGKPADDAEEPVEYILIAADRDGHLYFMDSETGAATLMLETFTDDGDGGSLPIGIVASVVYDAENSRLIAGTGGQVTCGGCLYVINTETGEGVVLADNVATTLFGVPGLVISPEGHLLAMEGDGGPLVLLDLATGAAQSQANAGNDGISGNPITFDSEGNLYLADDGADSPALYLLDITIGSGTLTVNSTTTSVINNIGFGETPLKALNSMVTHPETGAVVGLYYNTGVGPRYFVDLDLATATATALAQSADDLDGLAWVPKSIFPADILP